MDNVNDFLKDLKYRLDQASNLNELSEAAITEGLFDVAAELNKESKAIQDKVSDDLAKFESNQSPKS